MAGRECYHCKQWIEDFSTHDCWTTTPEALTRELSEDLRDAWQRLRETALSFGEQRMYASHSSIMFSRTACYCFVRPRPRFLELWIFLGRPLQAPQVKKATASSRVKVANLIQIRHRDEVEAPITDWMREAFEASPALTGRQLPAAKGPTARTPVSKAPRSTKRKFSSRKASETSRRSPARAAARGGRRG
jgi:hypothetical protein